MNLDNATTTDSSYTLLAARFKRMNQDPKGLKMVCLYIRKCVLSRLRGWQVVYC